MLQELVDGLESLYSTVPGILYCQAPGLVNRGRRTEGNRSSMFSQIAVQIDRHFMQASQSTGIWAGIQSTFRAAFRKATSFVPAIPVG